MQNRLRIVTVLFALLFGGYASAQLPIYTGNLLPELSACDAAAAKYAGDAPITQDQLEEVRAVCDQEITAAKDDKIKAAKVLQAKNDAIKMLAAKLAACSPKAPTEIKKAEVKPKAEPKPVVKKKPAVEKPRVVTKPKVEPAPWICVQRESQENAIRREEIDDLKRRVATLEGRLAVCCRPTPQVGIVPATPAPKAAECASADAELDELNGQLNDAKIDLDTLNKSVNDVEQRLIKKLVDIEVDVERLKMDVKVLQTRGGSSPVAPIVKPVPYIRDAPMKWEEDVVFHVTSLELGVKGHLTLHSKDDQSGDVNAALNFCVGRSKDIEWCGMPELGYGYHAVNTLRLEIGFGPRIALTDWMKLVVAATGASAVKVGDVILGRDRQLYNLEVGGVAGFVFDLKGRMSVEVGASPLYTFVNVLPDGRTSKGFSMGFDLGLLFPLP